jgi:hypothetical protein
LHALRDCRGRDEAVHVGADLPLARPFLRRVAPRRTRGGKDPAAFLARIHGGVHRDPGVDAEQVARTLLAPLAARLSPAQGCESRHAEGAA